MSRSDARRAHPILLFSVDDDDVANLNICSITALFFVHRQVTGSTTTIPCSPIGLISDAISAKWNGCERVGVESHGLLVCNRAAEFSLRNTILSHFTSTYWIGWRRLTRVIDMLMQRIWLTNLWVVVKLSYSSWRVNGHTYSRKSVIRRLIFMISSFIS